MNFCKDCKYYFAKGKLKGCRKFYRIDYVTGKKIYQSCKGHRSNSKNCLDFEPKPQVDLVQQVGIGLLLFWAVMLITDVTTRGKL